MGGPQLENGYTRIANELLEKVIATPFIATHLKIILVCWRYTYGFQKKQTELSESYISKATGISKRYISQEMKILIDCKVLKVIEDSTYTRPRVIAFNKNYMEWEYGTTVPQVKCNSTDEPEHSTTVEPQFNTTVEPQFHQKRKHKENLNIYSADFEKFYSLYPNPQNKQQSFKNWKTCLKKHSVEELLKASENYKNSVEGRDRQYIKTSSNFLGRDKFYIDFLPENYVEPEQPKTRGW